MRHLCQRTLLFTGLGLLMLIWPAVGRAIIGGSNASNGEFPWTVALINRNTESQFCGGSLIAAQWVLTAAHCFFTEEQVQDTFAADVQILMGTVNIEDGSGEIRTITRILHPGYDQGGADIALLELSQPANLDNPNISLITWNVNPNVPALDDTSTMVGWGGTQTDNSGAPAILQKINLPIVTCKEGDDPARLICAGGESGRDSCQGDSGGPLTWWNGERHIQIGLSSAGTAADGSCGIAGEFGTYTRISANQNWIAGYVIPQRLYLPLLVK